MRCIWQKQEILTEQKESGVFMQSTKWKSVIYNVIRNEEFKITPLAIYSEIATFLCSL